jgi:hypothetical protein
MFATAQSRTFVFSSVGENVKITIYKTKILPVILNARENLSLTIGKVHRLRVFQNRMMRISGPKTNEVAGG